MKMIGWFYNNFFRGGNVGIEVVIVNQIRLACHYPTLIRHKVKVICAVYGEGIVTDRKCQMWFANFHVDVESGRVVEVDRISSPLPQVSSLSVRKLSSIHYHMES